MKRIAGTAADIVAIAAFLATMARASGADQFDAAKFLEIFGIASVGAAFAVILGRSDRGEPSARPAPLSLLALGILGLLPGLVATGRAAPSAVYSGGPVWFWNWPLLRTPWHFAGALVLLFSAAALTASLPRALRHLPALAASALLALYYLAGASIGFAPSPAPEGLETGIGAAGFILKVAALFVLTLRFAAPFREGRVACPSRLIRQGAVPVALLAFFGAGAAQFQTADYFRHLWQGLLALSMLLAARWIRRGRLEPVPSGFNPGILASVCGFLELLGTLARRSRAKGVETKNDTVPVSS